MFVEAIYSKLGPAGSEAEGEQWDLKGQTKIVQIFISYGECIHSIQFQYVENGRLVISPIFGSSNFSGSGFEAVMLDYPSEYITGIDGRSSCSRVDGLRIKTNKREYGVFGYYEFNSNQKPFSFQFGPENQFGGFHGTHDSNILTSIGVYFKPLTTFAPTVRGTNQREVNGNSREQLLSDDELGSEDNYS